jgi:hypothetical protein
MDDAQPSQSESSQSAGHSDSKESETESEEEIPLVRKRRAVASKGEGKEKEVSLGRGKGKEKVTVSAPKKGKAVLNEKRKRPQKKARKSIHVIDPHSSGDDEEYGDDEEVELEGDVFREEEAGGSGDLEWNTLADGEVYDDMQPPLFSSVSGVIDLPNLANLGCLQILMLMIPLLFWQQVVSQTILYARVSRAAADVVGGRAWTDTSVQEILLWHGLVLAMTLHPLPSLADY